MNYVHILKLPAMAWMVEGTIRIQCAFCRDFMTSMGVFEYFGKGLIKINK